MLICTMKWGNILRCVLLGAAALALGACEDKELAAKSATQKARIMELEADVETRRRLLGEEPEGNPAEELKVAEKGLAAAQDRVTELELQLEELRSQREALAESFESYKSKYRIDAP